MTVANKPLPAFSCADCARDIDEIDEYSYMVTKAVWAAALRRHRRYGGFGSTFDLLCIACLERRLGRELVRQDFNWDVKLTSEKCRRSELLKSRMKQTAADVAWAQRRRDAELELDPGTKG